MVKTVVTHSKRFTFWGGAGDECLLTPHLIKYVLKIVPKINFKTGHLNFIKKIIKLIEAKNRIIVPDLGREGWGVAYQCV